MKITAIDLRLALLLPYLLRLLLIMIIIFLVATIWTFWDQCPDQCHFEFTGFYGSPPNEKNFSEQWRDPVLLLAGVVFNAVQLILYGREAMLGCKRKRERMTLSDNGYWHLLLQIKLANTTLFEWILDMIETMYNNKLHPISTS